MRVKRGTTHVKRRRNLLKQAKGFKWGRKNKIKQAKIAVTKSGVHAHRDRRKKKRDRRGLQQVRIGAAARTQGVSYSRLMGALSKKKIILDRKVLANIANDYPAVFNALVKSVQ
ncbi:MAG: 50S ribosomal protein L20 [Patescibacteria group bacterium]